MKGPLTIPILPILAVALFLVSVIALKVGAVSIPLAKLGGGLSEVEFTILMDIRLPRILLMT